MAKVDAAESCSEHVQGEQGHTEGVILVMIDLASLAEELNRLLFALLNAIPCFHSTAAIT
jgi:hypothetical protein